MMKKLRHFLPVIGRLLTVVLIAGLPVFTQDQRKVIEWPVRSVYNSRTNTTPDNHIVDRIDDVEIQLIMVEDRSKICAIRQAA